MTDCINSSDEWPIVVECGCGFVYSYPHFHDCPKCGVSAEKSSNKVKEYIKCLKK